MRITKPIPVEEIQSGIDISLKQTEMILESASILYDAEKYPASLALSILVIEEAAKTRLLLINRHESRDLF